MIGASASLKTRSKKSRGIPGERSLTVAPQIRCASSFDLVARRAMATPLLSRLGKLSVPLQLIVFSEQRGF